MNVYCICRHCFQVVNVIAKGKRGRSVGGWLLGRRRKDERHNDVGWMEHKESGEWWSNVERLNEKKVKCGTELANNRIFTRKKVSFLKLSTRVSCICVTNWPLLIRSKREGYSINRYSYSTGLDTDQQVEKNEWQSLWPTNPTTQELSDLVHMFLRAGVRAWSRPVNWAMPGGDDGKALEQLARKIKRTIARRFTKRTNSLNRLLKARTNAPAQSTPPIWQWLHRSRNTQPTEKKNTVVCCIHCNNNNNQHQRHGCISQEKCTTETAFERRESNSISPLFSLFLSFHLLLLFFIIFFSFLLLDFCFFSSPHFSSRPWPSVLGFFSLFSTIHSALFIRSVQIPGEKTNQTTRKLPWVASLGFTRLLSTAFYERKNERKK